MSSFVETLRKFFLDGCKKIGEGCFCYPSSVFVFASTTLVMIMYYQVNTKPPPCPPIDSTSTRPNEEKSKKKVNSGDRRGVKETLASSGTGVNGGEVIEAAKPMDDLDNDSDHDQSECE